MAANVTSANKSQYLSRKNPDKYIFEDDACVVFEEETNPQAPVHFLVVPKKIIPRVSEVSDSDEKLLGHLLIIAKNVAIQKGLDRTGYHVMVDEDFRTLKFKALHVFGRALQHMLWPVGPGSRL